MKVLVVDDDPVTCELIVEDLRHFGYDVTAATNGKEAFDLVRTGRYQQFACKVFAVGRTATRWKRFRISFRI